MAKDANDKVYQDAVNKLRMLLTASETASQTTDEEFSLMKENNLEVTPIKIGSVDELNNQSKMFFSEPEYKKPNSRSSHHITRLYTRNPKIKRSLFQDANLEKGMGERPSSWHNLLQIDDGEVSKGSPTIHREELELVQKQEKYISQLEKETVFCREQLSFVLGHVKEVLNDRTTQNSSDQINEAISKIFNTIHAWQNNVNLGAEKSQPKHKTTDNNNVFLKKLKESNEILSQALKEANVEVEDVKRREEEAVEQVKRSLQAAEQLKMEKTEYEYEVNQLKLQIERQQGRIRTLIEEQVTKIDEERANMEKRCQEQVSGLRVEISKHLEENSKLTLEVEKIQRLHGDAQRKLNDREQIAESLRQDLDKRIGQLQLDNVRINADRQRLEQENEALRIESNHCRQEMKAVESRFESEVQALRQRLTKAEERTMVQSKELLELTEEKSCLDREIHHLRNRSLKEIQGKVLKESNLEQHYQNKILNLEDLIKRQSGINSELHRQCHLITNKLESTSKRDQVEIESLRLKIRNLSTDKQLQRHLQNKMEDKGKSYERLSRKFKELELNFKRTHNELRSQILTSEELKQDMSHLAQENDFFKSILINKGLLPEKDDQPLKGPKKSSQ